MVVKVELAELATRLMYDVVKGSGFYEPEKNLLPVSNISCVVNGEECPRRKKIVAA